MANVDPYASEIARLNRMAAESRLRVVESQLALAFTLCAIAETEIRYDQPDEAIKVLNKVLNYAGTIRFHVEEKNHVPKAAISGLLKRLTELKTRTEQIEARLRQR